MTATMGASMTTSAIPDDNVSAWNYVPRPSFADGLDPWQRSNGTPPTTGGSDAKGNTFPGDAIRMQAGLTDHDGLVPLDLHGTPEATVTVHAERRAWDGSAQVRAELWDEPDGTVLASGTFPAQARNERGIATATLTLDDPPDGPLWLRLSTASGVGLVYAVRVHYGDADGLDIFTGDDLPPATETEEGYRWTGEPWASASYLGTIPAEPDPDPDPDPDPGPGPISRAALIARVLTLTEQDPDDEDVHTLAAEAVDLATALVYGYTRGRGFTVPAEPDFDLGDEPLPHGRDLAAVIVTAGARIMANPEQVDYFIGSVGARNGFTGWTLAERAALHNYRRTWA